MGSSVCFWLPTTTHRIHMEEMAVADVNSVTVPTQQLQKVASALFRRPDFNLIDDTQERKEKYLKLCVPLHKAALKGDWKVAKQILDQDPTLVRAAITKGWATVLHVAAGRGGADHVHFVEELVKMMSRDDMELQDNNGNTAFSFAAATGNMQVVEILKKKNDQLPFIRGCVGTTPLHMAAMQGHSEMALHLYNETIQDFEHADWIILLFLCVSNGIYDLALKVLEKNEDLAFERDRANQETVLHILARKPLSSNCQSQRYRKRLMKSCLKQTQQLQLVKFLWGILLKRGDSVIMDTIKLPSQVTFDAVEIGNFEFLAELISTYPDLIWDVDERNRSIIHIAVSRRYADIFNLIHDIGPIKDFIVTFVDHEDNGNLLHIAARLAPQDRLNIVSGAAFQMTLELLWFEVLS